MLLIESQKGCVVYEIKSIPKAKVIYLCWVSTLCYWARLVYKIWLLFVLYIPYIFPFLKVLNTSNFPINFTAKYLLPVYNAKMTTQKLHFRYFCVKYHFHVVSL